ncbi:MAG: tryptophan synthase subunit alpha [Candidatus Dormiibacterota bacterium]
MSETLAPDRLSQRLREARQRKRAALIGYLVAGDPDLQTTELVIAAVAQAGLDVLELGIPYGDPLADGPTIAAAGQRALAAGATLEATFGLVEKLQQLLPIVLFTYFNPVFHYGVERFAGRAAKAGAAGVIIPDITLEEIEEVRGALRARRLPVPLLVSPTTAPARAAQIAAATEGFLYVVSRLGVTGEGTGPDLTWLRAQVEGLRLVTEKPLAVGFGISTPAQVADVAGWSDGVIVGSGLVSSYAGSSGAEAARLAGSYVKALVAALPQTP